VLIQSKLRSGSAMKNTLIACAAAIVVAGGTLVSIPAAQANESGMASIHQWRKVGKKTCLVAHQHAGSGSGQTLKVAQAQAIGSWASFTDLEYGSSWANFNNAVEKVMRCGPTSGSFQCDLLATPCRGW
jgi:hypothetical protein